MDPPVELMAGLDGELLERIVRRLKELERELVAVVVFGSFARGTADEDSDIDVRAITRSEPSVPYRTWFEERRGSKPLHVSAGVETARRWMARKSAPQRWALGFPVLHEARVAWATTAARELLGDPPSFVHPPGTPEVEDFVEFLTKARRASAEGDTAGVRIFARAAAELAPGLLQPLNEKAVVATRRQALEAALSLEVAPEHYRDDLTISLGLVAADDDAVISAALRLGRELLAFLRERKPDVDPTPDVTSYLADGTLERHLGFTTD
ncbi:MAG: nucleotidyltransferase domain-containing protein [Gaiellaceae bacterium]